jgi:two-component system, OmpR family, response regulator
MIGTDMSLERLEVPDVKKIYNHMAKKVLIIDDEIDFCLLMKQFLQRRHFIVELAHTLHEGLEKMENYQPDLIFLDNNLPDGIGWDSVFTMIDRNPNVRINLISAFKNVKEQPLYHDQVKVLEKPVSFSALEKYLA